MRKDLTDFLRRIRTQIRRYEIATCIADGGEVRTTCCILSKNVLETKNVQKCSRLPQLRRNQQCKCQSHIDLFGSRKLLESPWGRAALILSFPKPFLTTLNFEFSAHFWTFFVSNAFLLKIQHIVPTSPPSALQMAVAYRPVCVLRCCRKSVRTFRTYSELPATIFHNFHLSLYECIFEKNESFAAKWNTLSRSGTHLKGVYDKY